MRSENYDTKSIVGAQWGDEGKGKAIDIYSKWADIIIRYAGGNNAGHTLEVNGKKLITHLIPSGVMHPGKTYVMGDQMVICPKTLQEEIINVKSLGLLKDDSALKISPLAHITMPYHIALDGLREAASGKEIGTTGRGIGPAYEFKAARRGIRMGHLRHPEMFKDLLNKALAKANTEIGYLNGTPCGFQKMLTYLEETRANLLRYVANTNYLIYCACKNGKKVLFEGAQGAGLDIDHGTYPFVTSSNTLAAGACLGSGIGPTMISEVIGVSKAYATRVGKGPFPTKIGGELEEIIRQTGNEYGATTGRTRDVGWLDLPQLRYSARLNGMTGLFITKLDVLRGISPIKLCQFYKLNNELFFHMDQVDTEMLGQVEPIYIEMDGFEEDISNAKTFDELPKNARDLLTKIKTSINTPIVGVSVGPERSQTIIL